MSTTTPHYSQLTDLVTDTWGPVCHLCNGGIDLTRRNGPWALQVDHVWPQSRGGCDHMRNLRPSHRRCNASRGNSLLHWARTPVCPCTVRPGSLRLDDNGTLVRVNKRAEEPWDGKPHRVARFMGHLVLWLIAANPLWIAMCIVAPYMLIIWAIWFFVWFSAVAFIWQPCGTRKERKAKREADDQARGYTTTVMA